MYRIGLSSKSNVFSDELFGAYKMAGVSTVEISNCSEGYDEIDFDNIKRLSDEYGVTLNSLHLPFKVHAGISHEIGSPSLHTVAVEDHKRIIRKAAKIGVKLFVIHPSGTNIPAEERRLWIDTCKESLRELAEFAESIGAVIAVENMTHDCLGNTIAEFEELVSADARLCVCFDTNHLLHESPAELIRRFGKKIVTLHVSDCNLEIEQHLMPGEGKVNFPEILATLGEVGYCGPWLYEVSYKCPKKPDDTRGFTCESFVQNAKELFAGK